jgi:hypothetical protein
MIGTLSPSFVQERRQLLQVPPEPNTPVLAGKPLRVWFRRSTLLGTLSPSFVQERRQLLQVPQLPSIPTWFRVEGSGFRLWGSGISV